MGDPDTASRASDRARAARAAAVHPVDAETAAEHRAHDESVDGERPEGRVPTAVFLQDGFAALDVPRFPADNPGSEPMPAIRLRRRGEETRDHHSIRLTPTEVRLIGDAVRERGAENFSGFIADAAVAVATNQLLVLLPHERALRAIGEELGRTMWQLGKVGVNLNQIARQLNMGDMSSAERVEQSLDQLDAVLAELRVLDVRLVETVGGR
ncbi:MobC family plasmid mobilization relaxosome protein [Streptacidiphilus sp. MAP12-20]|uniref:MobC family plasmid mobilization relaxosome protein n=1 Tax=Streptacidiphilus sp. MAP12-20 TaxID=3156299 RepID=UPI003518EED3